MAGVLDAATIAELRALTENLALPDQYELLATGAGTADRAGVKQTGATTVIESGPCSLTAGATRPEERLIADRAGTRTPYVIELPHRTQATGQHAIRVNGRTFAIVGGALKDGSEGLTARLVCEERV